MKIFVLIASLFIVNGSLASMTSTAPQALLLDLSTGDILLEKNAHQKMAPSSMTKILTAYMAFEALKSHDIQLTDQISVSSNAAKKEGTRMFLIPNQKVSIEDILQGIIAVSGNDACTAIAEHLAGSEEAFASLMNEKAKELGATESHFINASGLPHPSHTSTCWDLAKIAQKTLENFPKEYKKYYSLQTFSFNGITQYNKNTLLRDGFADGIKTGKTESGKNGIVASSEREGRRLLLVLNGIETEQQRAEEARRLLTWGFSFFQPVIFFKENEKISDIPVWRQESVPMVAPHLIGLSVPRHLLRRTEAILRYQTPLIPPIKKGQKVGVLVVTIPQMPPREFPLIAGKDVGNSGFIHQFLSFIKNLFH